MGGAPLVYALISLLSLSVRFFLRLTTQTLRVGIFAGNLKRKSYKLNWKSASGHEVPNSQLPHVWLIVVTICMCINRFGTTAALDIVARTKVLKVVNQFHCHGRMY
ncbi:hypothetical protein L1887_16981 [Cichorium endivia]|nr:hypothetical protein L1887_16981 [Cichorium endivia]